MYESARAGGTKGGSLITLCPLAMLQRLCNVITAVYARIVNRVRLFFGRQKDPLNYRVELITGNLTVRSKRYENFFEFGDRLLRTLAQEQNQSPEIILWYALRTLKTQEETLLELFKLIMAARRSKNLAQSRLDRINANTFTPKSSDEINENVKQKEVETMTVRAMAEMEQVFCSSIFLLFTTLIFETCAKIGLRNKRSICYGRFIGRVQLTQLIRVASNNFRHYEEWAVRDTDRVCDIKILRKAGVRPPWGRNACADIFELINWRNTNEMIAEIRNIILEIFRATGHLLA
jgi:hypothetical protein